MTQWWQREERASDMENNKQIVYWVLFIDVSSGPEEREGKLISRVPGMRMILKKGDDLCLLVSEEGGAWRYLQGLGRDQRIQAWQRAGTNGQESRLTDEFSQGTTWGWDPQVSQVFLQVGSFPGRSKTRWAKTLSRMFCQRPRTVPWSTKIRVPVTSLKALRESSPEELNSREGRSWQMPLYPPPRCRLQAIQGVSLEIPSKRQLWGMDPGWENLKSKTSPLDRNPSSQQRTGPPCLSGVRRGFC